MSGEPPVSPLQSRESRSRLFGWLVMSVIAVTVLSLLGANAPSRVKLLGLYAAGYGALAGFCLGHSARLNHLRVGRAVISMGAVLILAGWAGLSLESYRIQAAELRGKSADEPAAARASRLIDSAPPPDDAQSRAIYDDMKQSFARAADEHSTQVAQRTTIRAFLVNRVSPLGNWSIVGAALFWSAESLIACVLGAWILRRTSQTSAA